MKGIKNFFLILRTRWTAEMSRVGKWICNLSTIVFITFVASNVIFNMYNTQPPEWFIKIYPWVIVITVFIAVVAKFSIRTLVPPKIIDDTIKQVENSVGLNDNKNNN
jgi:hypothetical protein